MAEALLGLSAYALVDPDMAATNALTKAEGALERQNSWLELLTLAQKGNLQAAAKLILEIEQIYQGFTHPETPQEFLYLHQELTSAGLSTADLKAFSTGIVEASIGDTCAKFLQQHIRLNFATAGANRPHVVTAKEDLEKDIGADTEKRSVESLTRLAARQPITVGWRREIATQRALTKDTIRTSLETLHVDTRHFIDELVDGSMEDDHQLIPDRIDSPALFDGVPLRDKSFKPAYKRLLKEASLQSSSRMGLNPETSRKVDGHLAIIRANKKLALHKRLRKWAKENPEQRVGPERIARMRKIAKAILRDTRQVSEQSYEWILLFSLEATKAEASTDEQFKLTASLGGDQEPAPYPEAYIMEPLQKLRALKALYDAGEINQIPDFEVIFTASSQLAENTKDRQKRPIDPQRHTHNSVVAIARIQDFIRTYFPDIAEHVALHYFPSYSKGGMFRVHLAAITENLAISPDEFDQLFDLKGGVQDESDPHDPIRLAFGARINIYPARHKYSNGVVSNAHTLRFGADRTERPFHIVAVSAKEAAAKSEQIIENIRIKLDRGLFNGSSEELRAALPDLRRQLAIVAANEAIHAQIGMRDVHACYYRGDFDPSIQELLREKSLIPRGLFQRQGKMAKIMETFKRVTDEITLEEYLSHIERWEPHYQWGSKPDSFHTAISPHELAARMNTRLVTEAKTRDFLNMQLN